MTDLAQRTRLLDEYGASRAGHFVIIDTIGTPHPYCLTPKHVAHASDHFSGRLTDEAVRDAEKHGARCDICKGKLTYDEHEKALLVECHAGLVEPCGCGEAHGNAELHRYLLDIKDLATRNGFAGFAFIDRRR